MPNNLLAQDEDRFRILRMVGERPDVSQRELAGALGISLGKANYCLKALIKAGFVQMRNLGGARKLGNMYLVTGSGAAETAALTDRFIRIKVDECSVLQREIAVLTAEVAARNRPGPGETQGDALQHAAAGMPGPGPSSDPA